MKKYHISRIFLISLWSILGSGAIYATINYSELFPNSSTVVQSQTNGWTSPLSWASKEVMTPEWCKKITSSLWYSYHIPTGSTAEWTSFRDNLPSGVSIASCLPSYGIPFQVYQLISSYWYSNAAIGPYAPTSWSVTLMSWCASTNVITQMFMWGPTWSFAWCRVSPWNIGFFVFIPWTITSPMFPPWSIASPLMFNGNIVTRLSNWQTATWSNLTAQSTVFNYLPISINTLNIKIYGTINFTDWSTLSWNGNTLTASGPGWSWSLTFWR